MLVCPKVINIGVQMATRKKPNMFIRKRMITDDHWSTIWLWDTLGPFFGSFLTNDRRNTDPSSYGLVHVILQFLPGGAFGHISKPHLAKLASNVSPQPATLKVVSKIGEIPWLFPWLFHIIFPWLYIATLNLVIEREMKNHDINELYQTWSYLQMVPYMIFISNTEMIINHQNRIIY